jgi:hypothetical protein
MHMSRVPISIVLLACAGRRARLRRARARLRRTRLWGTGLRGTSVRSTGLRRAKPREPNLWRTSLGRTGRSRADALPSHATAQLGLVPHLRDLGFVPRHDMTDVLVLVRRHLKDVLLVVPGVSVLLQLRYMS